MNHFYKFQNGDEVTEKVTGFTGIITGSVHYLTGCNQYLIVSKSKDSTTEGVGVWFDEGRLTLIKEQAISIDSVKATENGCDMVPKGGKRGF